MELAVIATTSKAVRLIDTKSQYEQLKISGPALSLRAWTTPL
jgi:hypothetical protein